MVTRVVVFLLALLCGSQGVLANAQVSGVVRAEQGRVLANISVTLEGAGQTQSVLTDAFGRYNFNVPGAGVYQISYMDQNFINNIDEDPFPDEGTVYINTSDTLSLQENQSLNLSDIVLQRVEPADTRQASTTVTDCLNFGDNQTPQTLSYALENARQIIIQCSGALKVPEIVIARDVIISASSGLTLEAEGVNRILRVLPGITLDISGVDLTGGRFNLGSALFNAGNTSITDADITNNRGDTATILNAGVLDLQQVNQYRNSVLYDSVWRNTGVITGFDVSIESHVASAGPVLANSGNIELTRCNINGLGTNNVFSVDNEPGSQLKLFNCTISNSGSLFRNQGTLEIYDSSIDANRGDQGLIESLGVLKIGGTGVTNNEVSGLIIYSNGLAEITNSTVSTNRAGFSVPGNADNIEDFRGVVSNEGLMRINSSTIANNIHRGFTDRQIGNAGELQMSNTVIVGTGNGEECGGASAITSQGHNLHTDGSCGAVVQTDIPFGNAALLPLASSGALGKTHPLTAESDAIDAGNCNNGTLLKDQRGVARPQGAGCDIGAFELEQSAEIESAGADTEASNGTNSGNESSENNGSDNESTEIETNDTVSSNSNESEAEPVDESSASDMQADISNDDTTIDAIVQTPGGGGAMTGMNALLVIVMLVAFRRRAVGYPGFVQ